MAAAIPTTTPAPTVAATENASGTATPSQVAPSTASPYAGPTETLQAPKPNGKDDTATIQKALNACAAHGPGCTVQLQAGTYKTSQLVTSNFQGTLRGVAENGTTIEALPTLPVNMPDPTAGGECQPNTTTCLWPTLILFIDGNVEVSDLSIRITATDGGATAPWSIGGSEYTSVLDALRFMGKRRADVSVDRVAIEGQHDKAATSLGGFNLGNGVIFTGELPRSATPFDYYTLTGSLTVRSSSFKTMYDGVGTDGFISSSEVTIGGSSSAGNHFDDIAAGIDLASAEGSVFEVSYNVSTVSQYGMAVVPWQSVFVPSGSSQYAIHDNTFVTGADSDKTAAGIFVQDDSAEPRIQADISHNTINAQAPGNEGISVQFAKGAAISGNTISGTAGSDAIGLKSVTHSTVSGNDVSGFKPDASLGRAQIYLDSGTADDSVACLGTSDTVLDNGTGNTMAGCHS
jgi:Periplasmic copper-binding protein (NosD)